MFVSDLSWYIALLEVISGVHVEDRPEGINLPAEYRWNLGGTTPLLLRDPTGRLAVEDRIAIESLATVVAAVPAETRSLDEQEWRRPRELAVVLLPRMLAMRATIYAELDWPTPDGAA